MILTPHRLSVIALAITCAHLAACGDPTPPPITPTSCPTPPFADAGQTLTLEVTAAP